MLDIEVDWGAHVCQRIMLKLGVKNKRITIYKSKLGSFLKELFGFGIEGFTTKIVSFPCFQVFKEKYSTESSLLDNDLVVVGYSPKQAREFVLEEGEPDEDETSPLGLPTMPRFV